jgi:hypothetical protein
MGPPGQENSRLGNCRFRPEAPPCPSVFARVQDFLNANISEEQISALLSKFVRDNRIVWQVKAVATIVAADVILFKTKMNDNMGPNGVVIRVWGVDGIKPVCTIATPDIWDWILPEDWNLKMKVVTTVPLYWTVTPR